MIYRQKYPLYQDASYSEYSTRGETVKGSEGATLILSVLCINIDCHMTVLNSTHPNCVKTTV